LRGVAGDAATISRIQAVLQEYSRQVADFAGKFLLPYAGQWTLDLATFRPFAEERRGVPLHRRSDLLHVNVSTSRPTRGSRILRVFTNLSPEMPRVWQVAEATFETLARQYAQDAGLLRITEEASYADAAGDAADKLGLRPASRTPFDMFMLRFQDYMKENAAFQRSCSKVSLEFPPLATWMVFTDSAAHAAISGRNEIEQTFLIPPGALVAPEHAPIRILESLAGYSLTA